VRPGTRAREPEPTAHLVHQQQALAAVAHLAHGLRELARRQRLVDEAIVPERRHQHAGQVALGRLRRSLQARGVVVLEGQQVRAILGQRAGRHRRAPGIGAVVRARSHEDLAPARMRARHAHRHRRRVRAVLAEHRPLRVRHLPGELFRQLDDQCGRAGHAVAGLELRDVGSVDLRIAIAEQVRPVRTHQVDVPVAVHIPQPRTLRAREELRKIRRQQRGGLVPVMPPGITAAARLRSAASAVFARMVSPRPGGARRNRRVDVSKVSFIAGRSAPETTACRSATRAPT
jgi:hypothetical protein